MLRLEDVARVVGGQLRFDGPQVSLETKIGGLRALVVRRVTRTGPITLDLAVATPHARELEPLFAIDRTVDWVLDEDRAIPRLEHDFVFTGCRRGVLFAVSTGNPSLEQVVATLWWLADWARKPWRPLDERDFSAGKKRRTALARHLRSIVIALLVLYCAWVLTTC